MSIRENGFFYTGVVANDEQDMESWRNTPVVVVCGTKLPSFEEVVHASAIRAGLPEIKGYYGYDFGEHQFIRLPDADQGTPDSWPSRRLDDILSDFRKNIPASGN